MRYFDPRILPYWIETLSPVQRASALSPVGRWLCMKINGFAEIIDGGNDASPQPHVHMSFALAQQDFLVSHSFPYTILSSIEDDDPTLLCGMTYAQKALFVFRTVEIARKLGLHSFIDLKTFCVIAPESIELFTEIPEVRKALSDGVKGRFHEHVAQWSDEVWCMFGSRDCDNVSSTPG
jgi:hypothetical protein